MPELPEVETVKRGLNDRTLHQAIQPGGSVLLAKTVAYPEPEAFLTAMEGCAIDQWQRRGKYLIADLSKDKQPAGHWGVHLRMTGQLLWLDQKEPVEKHTRVRLFFPESKELRYIDQRTFGQFWWVPPGIEPQEIITGLQNLGPEPFDPAFDVAYLEKSFKTSKRPIKNSLLDQSLVAGIGNIYADEALFLSKIHPSKVCTDLTPKAIALLHTNILQVLTDSINAKGTTFSDFRTVEGINGNYGGQAWVYNRTGQACKVCDTAIERLKMAGRSAHYCPQCQPYPKWQV
jgi:formamidopyrimidine-DNA glycosylase